MTPVPSSPVALLDQLDELRAKATPGPWRTGGSGVVAGLEYVALGVRTDPDAALIVAAVNAVGPLTAAVRAVLELVGELDAEESDPDVPTSAERRAGWHAALAAVTAALSVTP